MTRQYKDALRDILDAIEKAQSFVAGIDFDTFEANDEKTFAVIRALEIIGEAVKQISESERDRYPCYSLPGYSRDARQANTRLLCGQSHQGVGNCPA